MQSIFSDAASEARLLKQNKALVAQNARHVATIRRLQEERNAALRQAKSSGSSYVRNISRSAWITPIIQRIIATKQIALALTPGTSIASTDNKLLQHGYANMTDLKIACAAAVRGDPTKIVRCSTGAAGAGLSLSLPLNTVVNCCAGVNADPDGAAPTEVFGWLVRISASQADYAYRGVEISVGKPSVAAGVVTIPNPVISYVVNGSGRNTYTDLVVLSPGNAAGVASVVPGIAGGILGNSNTQSTKNILSVANLGQASLFAQIESLNATDFLLGSQSATLSRDTLSDYFGDQALDDGDEGDWVSSAYSGIRDGE